MKPRKRYSYHVFLLILTCAALPSALPYFKDSIPSWVFGILAIIGVVAQHLKQEVSTNDDRKQVPQNDP